MASITAKPSAAELSAPPQTSKSPTEIVEGAAANERNERSTLLAGLLAPTPRISQVYLYDARGSELYEDIVRAPEYYLPDTESLLLTAHAAEIVASSTAAPIASQAVIELGAGAGERTLALLRAALPPGLVTLVRGSPPFFVEVLHPQVPSAHPPPPPPSPPPSPAPSPRPSPPPPAG